MLKSVVVAAVLLSTRSLAAADMPQQDNPWFRNAQKVIQFQKARQPITHNAKNVILMVSDGNGVGSNYATRLYVGQQTGGYGEEYVLPHEKFPYLALAKTYTVNGQTPDSAGTATAMNTGIKTRSGALGLSESARFEECADVETSRVTSFAELMHAAGKSIGFVTTARITHATPAAGYAQSADRRWEDDSFIPEGSDQKDIALQLYEKRDITSWWKPAASIMPITKDAATAW